MALSLSPAACDDEDHAGVGEAHERGRRLLHLVGSLVDGLQALPYLSSYLPHDLSRRIGYGRKGGTRHYAILEGFVVKKCDAHVLATTPMHSSNPTSRRLGRTFWQSTKNKKIMVDTEPTDRLDIMED